MLAGSAVYPRPTEAVLNPTEPSSPAAPIRAHTQAGDTEHPLDPKAVTLWRIHVGIRGAFIMLAVLGVELLLGTPLPAGTLTALAALGAVAVAILLPPLRYRWWRFSFQPEHLRLRHGVLFRTHSIVPYARIQHVDTRHGPLDRWLGLASLVVFTAGTRGAILTIPALAERDAERFRDRLAALSGAGDAV